MKKTLVLALAAAFSLAAHAADTLRYEFIAENGKKIGEQVVERDADGLTRVRMIYKNNGRGPELNETFRLAADGTVSE